MIMMRPTPSTKMGKPPPPVPPRPSKTLVAEAMAQTRRLSPEQPRTGPMRSAPPPPPPTLNKNDLNKSQSCASVIVKKPIPIIERSISEEVKCSTRTVIFQSPKIAEKKSPPKANNGDGVVVVKKVDSLRSAEKVADKRVERAESLKTIERTDSFKNDDHHWDQMLNDRNHVNTLIDEMFASVLDVSSGDEDTNKVTITTRRASDGDGNNEEIKSLSPPRSTAGSGSTTTTVVVVDDNKPEKDTPTVTIEVSTDGSSNSSTCEKKVKFDDRMNHELLISELESMRLEEEKILKRQRLPCKEIFEGGENAGDKIHHSDWVEVSDGQEVRLSSCQITIEDDLKNINNEDDVFINNKLKLDYERIKTMSSLHGLPPLPKSLSGFSLLEGHGKPPTPARTTSMRGQGHLAYPKINGETPASTPGSGRKSTGLDTQLAILRREMYSLRQLDLSLLSQLWSLNESIQDFRQILQDQEDRVLSPPSPSPAPSSGDEGDGDEFYMSTSSMNFRTPPPPPPARRPSSSSNASSLG